MIRKITSAEYLKRVDNMTAVERSEYARRVGDWLVTNGLCLPKKGEIFEAGLQNALQVSATWNDRECQAFEEGVVLLSALVGVADTKLPELLYSISAKRSIRILFQLLRGQTLQERNDKPLPKTGGNSTLSAHSMRMQAGAAKEMPLRADMSKLKKEAPLRLFEEGVMEMTTTQRVVPVRPKHIDQYIHLLPKKTQEKAALVQGLYRELDDTREKLRLLMDDQTASASDREALAKKATRCDNALRKIFDELDAEWGNLVKEGRVVVDDLGNARVIPVADPADTMPQKSEVKGEDTDRAQTESAGRTLTSEQKARRRELRKWLIDIRRGNGVKRDERVKQWYENFREYYTLEGNAAFSDEKIKDAIKHFGIDTGKLEIK
jgi:hypothetical protein